MVKKLCYSISTCRQSYCGRCSAEYLIGDRWLKCYVILFLFEDRAIVVDAVLSIKLVIGG